MQDVETNKKLPRLVAFIFDDGPVPEMAKRSLPLLDKLQIRVTFAYVGEKVAAAPMLARAAAEAGHELVNHSYSHPHFKKLEDATVQHQITETQTAVLQATSRQPRWFWPPYLDSDERIERLVGEKGVERFPISRFCLISTEDWNRDTDAATIREKALSETPDSSVILCHEWREETWNEMPAIVANLRARGCEFVTFSELAATSYGRTTDTIVT